MSANRKEPKKILTAATEREVSEVNSYFALPHTMRIPLLHPIVHRAHYYDDGGWEMPKVYTETYMKSNWSETEMFKIK